MTTPRESARTHLPDLDASFDALRATFGARLMHLVTPDGEWGQRPAWLDLPHHTAADMAPSQWPSVLARVSRETRRTTTHSEKGRRR